MDDFGSMGAKGGRLVGPLGAPVQVWTPDGREMKGKSDKICEKRRGVDVAKLPEAQQKEYLADREEGRKLWAGYWNSVGPKVRRVIEDALTEGTQ